MNLNIFRVSLALTTILVCSILGLAENRTKEHVIQSKFPKEERRFTVTLPQSYEQAEWNYPVLFLLDSESNLGFTRETVDFLSSNREMPEMLIVGLPGGGTKRARDYLPNGALATPTKAKGFLNYIEHELKPFLSKNYRVAPFSILSGHSYGGVFVVFANKERPQLFNGYITQSPFLDQRITKLLFKKSKSQEKTGLYFYANLGDEPSLKPGFDQLRKSLEGKNTKTSFFQVDRELTHMTTRMLGQYNALTQIFGRRWKGGTQESIVERKKRLKSEYGYEVAFGIQDYVQTVRQLLPVSRTKALETARASVERFPESVLAHFFLSVSYRANDDRGSAAKIAKKALSLIDAGKASDSEKSLIPTLKKLSGQP